MVAKDCVRQVAVLDRAIGNDPASALRQHASGAVPGSRPALRFWREEAAGRRPPQLAALGGKRTMTAGFCYNPGFWLKQDLEGYGAKGRLSWSFR